MGNKKGPKFRQRINDAVASFTLWPSTLPKITMKIFRKKGGTMSLTGKMWHTFARISTAISAPHLDFDELQAWDTVMDCACSIIETNWTTDQIKDGDLKRLIYHFAKTMQSSFSDDDGVNWSIPNFETLFVLPDLITFLGPLWYQATDLEESLNKEARQCLYVSNHKQGAESIMRLMQKRRGILNQVSSIEEQELFKELFSWALGDDATERDVDELTPTEYGANLDITGNALRRVHSLLQQMTTKDNRYTLKSTRAVSFTTLTGTKAVLERGISIKYMNGPETKVGLIQSFYIIEALVNGVDTVQLPMATVKVPRVLDQYKDFRTRVLDLTQAEWRAIPLNWCQHKLLGIVSLFHDPRNKNRVFVLD